MRICLLAVWLLAATTVTAFAQGIVAQSAPAACESTGDSRKCRVSVTLTNQTPWPIVWKIGIVTWSTTSDDGRRRGRSPLRYPAPGLEPGGAIAISIACPGGHAGPENRWDAYGVAAVAETGDILQWQIAGDCE